MIEELKGQTITRESGKKYGSKPLFEEKMENLQRVILQASSNHNRICEILSPMPIESLSQGCTGEAKREERYLSSLLDQMIYDLETLTKEQSRILEDLRKNFGDKLHL